MGTDRLQTIQSRGEACKLQYKSRLHKSKSAYGKLQAAHFKTLANSHAQLADSHWLMSRCYMVKMEAAVADTLRLHYELQVRFHLLQAEHHRERFTYYQEIAIAYRRKAEAHEMLNDYLQHKIAKRQRAEE